MTPTPICDFIENYRAQAPLRLHMPGHKGMALIGCEADDITEIPGADSLYEAAGIIAQSEEIAGRLFGARTFYSAEGSSLCIRAMLRMLSLYAVSQGKTPCILAGRNAHKSFVSGAALLDLPVRWLSPEGSSYLSCPLSAEMLEAVLTHADPAPTAVYLTVPDYLGHTVPLRELAAVCHAHGVLLAVDNAHGAYLKFLPESRHPMDLGADICCDSAHKTLPVLTGGAYLHVSHRAPELLSAAARESLALFGSTSPSYLILQSLDRVNRYLGGDYPARLAAFCEETAAVKAALREQGYSLAGDEPLKLTLCPKSYGYTGTELACELAARQIVCEFADPDFTVCMVTPETGKAGLTQLLAALLSIPRRTPIGQQPPAFALPERVLSPREALLAPCETVPVAHSVGRVLAAVTVGCPPAVPIAVSGERITPAVAEAFAYYGIDACTVVKP